jgi:hypothetical protein
MPRTRDHGGTPGIACDVASIRGGVTMVKESR